MLKSKSLRKAMSMLCALCMLFSLFANGSVAFAADDEVAAEVSSFEHADDMDASGEEFTDEETEETSADQPDQIQQESDSLDEAKAIAEKEDSSDTDPVSPSADDVGEIESFDTSDETIVEPDSITYNAEPINGNASKGDVSIKVSAPSGSFPEGTALQIVPVNEEYLKTIQNSGAFSLDTAAAFDISFLSSAGDRLQPKEGRKVQVEFCVNASSTLAPKEGEESALYHIYHIEEDGAPTLVKTCTAAPLGQETRVSFSAERFSVYLIAKMPAPSTEQDGDSEQDEMDVYEAEENTSYASQEFSIEESGEPPVMTEAMEDGEALLPEDETVALTAEEPTADDEETPSSWSLGLVFYDSTVDNGRTPLTEINWDASDGGYGYGETRVITMQINYRNTGVEQDYAPGDLTISVPNLVYNTFGSEASKPNWVISTITVGANDNTHTGYNWNFTTGSSPTYSQSIYRFINAEALSAGSNFEGSIQIVYTLRPNTEGTIVERYEDACTHSYSYAGQAELRAQGEEAPIASNEVSFEYTRTYEHPWQQAEFDVKKTAVAVENPGELMAEGADNYYWVKYIFTYDEPFGADSYPWIFAKDYSIADSFPEGCVVLDRRGDAIAPDEHGTYWITETDNIGNYGSVTKWGTSGYTNRTKICYVGYPKSEYNQENGNLDIRNEAALWGQYTNGEEAEALAQGDVALNLNEYDFQYPPGHYNVYKSRTTAAMRYQDILSGQSSSTYNYTTWRIRPVATYTGKKMDVEFGDDVLFYLNDQNQYVRAQDEDYCFRTISLSRYGKSGDANYWTNESGAEIPQGKYDVKLFIRRAGSSGYTLYDSFKNREKGSWTFTKEDKVVGYYFRIYDMTEGLYPSTNLFCTGQTLFFMQDIPEAGTVYDFDYIKAYLDDGAGGKYFANQPGPDSYATFITQADMATFDQTTYGEYRMRAQASNTWAFYDAQLANRHLADKSVSSLTQNEAEEKFTGRYTLRYYLYGGAQYDELYQGYYKSEDRISYLGMYDLLPKGVDLEATAEELLVSLTFTFTNNYSLFFDSDWQPISREALMSRLRERMALTVTPDWRGTGRTHLALRCDLADAPFYFFSTGNNTGSFNFSLSAPFSVSYDSYLEYGKTYTNYLYTDALNADGRRVLARNTNYYDNAPHSTDINENGTTDGSFSRDSASMTINSLVSTHQSLEKTVMTPKTGRYVSGQAEGTIDGEYSYRLRVRTGSADVTNLVVYDSIERYMRTDGGFVSASGGADAWHGTLLGVDTSHPTGKGYTVRVWWSASERPGRLHADGSWQLYSGSTDGSAVRSLAFEYLDQEGNPAIIPANSASYLYIKMKAPDVGYETKLAYNGSYSDWTALDNFGNPVDFITGINSGIVRVSLTDTTSLSLEKSWQGDPEEQPTSVWVQLLRNGSSYGEPVELSAEADWKYTFMELPKYNDEGNEYTYSVKELPMEGFYAYLSQNDEQAVLVNVPTTSVSARKIWVDNDNYMEARPERIVLQLCQTVNGTKSEVTGKTLILSGEGNEWVGHIDGLPALTQDGEEIMYSFLEKEVPEGYMVSISEDGLVITNTITGKISVPVTKNWIGAAAKSVTVELLADGVKVSEIVLSEDNNWKHTFTDLDQYNNGIEIIYTIREVAIDNYSSAITGDQSGYTITNTNTETIAIPVVKQWVGSAAEAATINLLADGEVIATVELNAGNDWKYTFTQLQKYDKTDGHEIVYDVQEVRVDGYVQGRSGSVETGFTFINTIAGKVSIPVTKKWIGPAADSVTVELLADGVKISEAVLNEANGWQYTFADLDQYNNGIEIVYTIREVSIDNYSSAITGDQSGYTITNTNTETIAIPVVKQWVGSAAEAATINLLADGEVIATVELNAGNDWKYTFTQLQKYDKTDGHEIVYDVQEVPVDGYEQGRSGSVDTGFTFTNTITGKVSVPVTKKWIGPAADSVTVELLADGVTVAEAILNEANDWQYAFTDFDQYNNGVEIVYTIREVNIDGYSSKITGNMSDGFVVTNTNTQTINIPVEKRWVGTAANSVTIRLYADGVKVADVVLNKNNNWRHTFTSLSKHDNTDGHEIVYTITEDAVNGYTTSIDGNMNTGFVVTNTKNTTPPHSFDTPKTGDESHLLLYFLTMILSGTGLIGVLLFKRKRSKRQKP